MIHWLPPLPKLPPDVMSPYGRLAVSPKFCQYFAWFAAEMFAQGVTYVPIQFAQLVDSLGTKTCAWYDETFSKV